MKIFTVLPLCGLLAGCSTGSTIVTGTKRAAIAPEAVTVYSAKPENCEEVAMISARANGRSQRSTNKAVKRLRERAADVGANGVLIQEQKQHKGVIVYGVWIVPQDELQMSGLALWVP